MARVPIDALEHRDAGPLAVRAGNGDDLEGRVPKIEPFENRSDALEGEVDLLGVVRLEPPEPVIEGEMAPRRRGQGRALLRLRRAPGERSAWRAARQFDRAPGGGRGSCRWHPSRAGTRRAGTLPAASRPWSARSRAGRRSRSARPAPRC